MKNTIILFFILILQLSCKKSNSESLETPKFIENKYRVYDSIIVLYNNMGGISKEEHYALNRTISVYKNNASGELVYNSDTFAIYRNTPLTYSNKHRSFPLLKFNNDSLSIYRHVGGIGYQTWEYLECVKY
jgi:hypothetical protein